mmetsp:Transcript_23854/g.39446  ORF Transcript_23854/g.39446 Transcript_23854/m.39446 type:complete len:272 (-) Transcript_23854:288-1103(-)|eukprot:CAMPEP_0119339608 /NCGR_PEP_ID=MMETSP1333-20130426/98631_1 /TAXON_ID=418940 /ORGANISM="Scyphosphaera apsteinii, Strain RCC1455" /LENGTH=271 /DNA_ID=CAMNT_0007351167 /DNA_START=62 /DNA_END=877 /DNA_ORIENTATION=-
MARNEEKAQALLNRFVAAKRDANRPDKSQRPYLATECTDVPDCELYRGQIIKEISKKVSLIQNEGLEEHRVRDLNDQINKLMREKGHWERQIKALGGPDHFRTAPKLFNEEDAEEVVPGKGYRYYGAAKKLPGVRELFKKAAPERTKRTRFEMLKSIDADYYGYRDDDDGILIELEKAVEGEKLAENITRWEKLREERINAEGSDVEPSDEEERIDVPDQFVAHVEVPDQTAIERRILERRKRELLELAAGDLSMPPPETAEAPKLVPASW